MYTLSLRNKNTARVLTSHSITTTRITNGRNHRKHNLEYGGDEEREYVSSRTETA